MNTIIPHIKEFYGYYHTYGEIKPDNPFEVVIKCSLCTRTDFLNATFEGLVFFIYNIALTVFYGMALVFTEGRTFKTCFWKNVNEAIVHGGSIPISIAGIIFPQKVNQDFLKLVPVEVTKDVEGDAVVETAILVGGLAFRKRFQL